MGSWENNKSEVTHKNTVGNLGNFWDQKSDFYPHLSPKQERVKYVNWTCQCYIGLTLITMGLEKQDNAMVRAVASYQLGPGSIPVNDDITLLM